MVEEDRLIQNNINSLGAWWNGVNRVKFLIKGDSPEMSHCAAVSLKEEDLRILERHGLIQWQLTRKVGKYPFLIN